MRSAPRDLVRRAHQLLVCGLVYGITMDAKEKHVEAPANEKLVPYEKLQEKSHTVSEPAVVVDVRPDASDNVLLSNSTEKAQSNYHSPPEYCFPKEREFIICDSLASKNLKVFASENGLRLFREYKKLNYKDHDFAKAKADQNMSKGLPLLACKRALNLGVGEIAYLKLYECVTAPEAKDRLYDKVDNRQVGEVFKKTFIGYCRYRLHFKGLQIVVLAHSRLPIVDFEISGDRYRFIKDKASSVRPERFLYELFSLDHDQQSLLDDMTSDMKINKSNELLGSKRRNLFSFGFNRVDPSVYQSANKDGIFEYQSSKTYFSRTKKSSVLRLFSDPAYDLDKNSEVNFHALVLVTVALILKSHEDDLETSRKSSISASSSIAVTGN